MWIAANTVLIQGTVTTFLLALSLQLPMRVGVFSFAGAGLFGVGGYTAGMAMVKFGLDTWTAVSLGVLVAAFVGALLGLVLQRLNGLYLAMATVAFDLIVAVLAGNLKDLTGGHVGLFGAAGRIELWHLGVILALVITAFVFLERGGIARRIDAVRTDPALAASLGIPVAGFRWASFVISGVVAGLGGALQVLLRTTISPENLGFHLVVLALTVVIVGGARSWIGALIGTVIFTWLPALLSVAGEWRTVVYGIIVTLAAIFFPGGIWGSIVLLRRRLSRSRRAPVPDPIRAEEVRIT
ncbi:branched-chain amino acid ABC transporter permease [Microbacterium sp. zg.B48]|uniref:branched-chain amino acid ABC transporter permease n=1 Tax=Microbacterium sp. zg.B48 TaxID=2969408 RepID=UPI00214B969C|nr:branched-chain amino acid ABC transporter permease [Microbacterium sp. zg.B48]MCR2764357.1 branched-chain amino acid ABC transporter permease [Microbacterium sp. zg.B48]